MIDLGNARDVKRASLDTIAATDAVLLHEINDAIRVLHDCTGSRTGLEAARIFAVHATILADQPLEIIRLRVNPFTEAHDGEARGCEVPRIVVNPAVHANFFSQVVPFQAGDLTGLTADTF